MACCWLALSLGSVAPPLEVRRSAVSLVPPEPLMLGGYTERQGATFEPGGDDLMARTAVFTQGRERIALCSIEMLTVPESLAREVRKRLPSDVRLFLTATHTHCAPDSQMLNDRMTFAIPGIATYKRRWLQWYADRIADGVGKALASEPAVWGPMEIVRGDVGLSRVRRTGGRADPSALVVFGGGKPALLHYAAHPVNYEPSEKRLRSDWPGAAMRSLGVIALNGAIGDVSPHASGDTPERKVQAFVDAFAGLASRAKRAKIPERDPRLRWAEVPIHLSAPRAHPEFARANGVSDELAAILVRKFAPETASIVAIALDGVALVGVPGEPTAELGRRIQAAGRKAGFDAVLVVSHTNGWIGYVLTSEDYARGGYEATLAFHGPGAGDALVEAASGCLVELAGTKPGR